MVRRRRRTGTGSSLLLKSADYIGWALGGLEREIAQTRERLAVLIAEAAKLRARVGKPGGSSSVESNPRSAAGRKGRRGRMTPEGRKRISEMMKKRWQEAKKKNKNRL